MKTRYLKPKGKMQRLPRKPSKLIRLALEELRRVESMPDKYQVDMSAWHVPSPRADGPCRVCLAGAVMSSGCARTRAALPYRFGPRVESRLLALDSFRVGDIANGLHHLRIKRPRGCPTIFFVPGYADREWFHKCMNHLADRLEHYGL